MAAAPNLGSLSSSASHWTLDEVTAIPWWGMMPSSSGSLWSLWDGRAAESFEAKRGSIHFSPLLEGSQAGLAVPVGYMVFVDSSFYFYWQFCSYWDSDRSLGGLGQRHIQRTQLAFWWQRFSRWAKFITSLLLPPGWTPSQGKSAGLLLTGCIVQLRGLLQDVVSVLLKSKETTQEKHPVTVGAQTHAGSTYTHFFPPLSEVGTRQ